MHPRLLREDTVSTSAFRHPLAILTVLGGLLIAAAPAGAHGAGAGITYNGHAGLGANPIALSKGSIVTNNNDPDTLARCLLSGAGESVATGQPSRRHPGHIC